MADKDEDLTASTTEGYKVGEKKSVDAYTKLDAEDESLNKWKASLGLATGNLIGDPNDKRTVIIEELALVVQDRRAIVVDLKTPQSVIALKDNPFTIKEGAQYQMRIKFRVQHEVISGLRYIHVVKRKGIRVEKMEEMLGSYGPNTDTKPYYEKLFPMEEAPSGMLARGHYEAKSKFTDDDSTNHLEFEWSFDIKKSWE